jgi:NRPS condensation-like uncharacterized protein
MLGFENFKLPAKVHLSGDDYFQLMLEGKSINNTVGNNVIRVVFDFSNEAEASTMINNIQSSPIIHWICNITISKGVIFTKRYWKYINRGKKITINEHFNNQTDRVPKLIIDKKINLKSDCLISFDLIRYESKKISLVLSWHHIIMDGRGASVLINHLHDGGVITQKILDSFFPSKVKSLSLFQHIKNMYEVKKFIETSSKAPIAVVGFNDVIQAGTLALKTVYFNDEETALIEKNAKLNGVMFGVNNYLIACCAHVAYRLSQVHKQKGIIWLPVPQDGRKRGGDGPIIGNCVSFLFYRLLPADFDSVSSTVKAINKQMMAQAKMEMPKKYAQLLIMMQHIPLWLYRFLITRSSKGVVASFLYSSAGEGVRDANTLMNNSVSDVLIIPPFLYPPGLTFSFMHFNNAIKMNLVYCENNFTPHEIVVIENEIKELLIGNK